MFFQMITGSGFLKTSGLVAALAMALLGALTEPVRAEEETIDFTEMSLSELMEVDVVYGASKYYQKAQDAPAVISTIDATEIEAFGYRTLKEVLDSMRGFYTTYDRNYQYLGVRGFGRPGDYNSRILILVDGNRTNENIYDSSLIGSGTPIDLDLVERIEVIRGPSSSIYGTSAIFGIINVVTKHGHQIDGVEAEVEVGSFGTKEGRLSLGAASDSGMEWLLSGTIGRRDGQDLYFAEFDDPATNNGIFADGDQVDWQSLLGKVSYKGFHLETVMQWYDKKVPTAPWGTVFNNNITETMDNQGYVSASYEGSVSDRVDLLAKVSYNFYDYEGSWIYDYADVGDPPDLVTSMDDSHGKWLNTEVQLSRQWRENLKVSGGVELRENFQQDQAVWDADPFWSYLDDERDSSNWGAYLQGNWMLHQKLTLDVGVRHDEYPTFGGTTNPRVALVTRPAQGSVVKFLYGSAFRAPNLYELYYHDNGASTKANLALFPETIETFEVAWDQQIGEDLHTVVSVFSNQISDLIDQAEDPADALLQYTNSGQVNAQGFEMEVNGRHEGGWRHRLSYSYQYSDYEDGSGILTNSPRHLAKFNLMAPLQSADFRAGLEMQYSSRRLTYMGDYADGFLLTNLTLTKDFVRAGVKIQGGVRNLFDEDYGHPGGVEHAQNVLWQDGRSFRLSVAIGR